MIALAAAKAREDSQARATRMRMIAGLEVARRGVANAAGGVAFLLKEESEGAAKAAAEDARRRAVAAARGAAAGNAAAAAAAEEAAAAAAAQAALAAAAAAPPPPQWGYAHERAITKLISGINKANRGALRIAVDPGSAKETHRGTRSALIAPQ